MTLPVAPTTKPLPKKRLARLPWARKPKPPKAPKASRNKAIRQCYSDGMAVASNKCFNPKSLLDKTYEVGLFIKGFDGAMELLGACTLALVPSSAFYRLTQFLTQSELANDPHDFWATHIARYGNEIA